MKCTFKKIYVQIVHRITYKTVTTPFPIEKKKPSCDLSNTHNLLQFYCILPFFNTQMVSSLILSYMLTSGLATTDTPYHAVTRFQPILQTTMFLYTSNVLILFKSNIIICHLSFGFLAKKQLLRVTPNRVSRSSYFRDSTSRIGSGKT